MIPGLAFDNLPDADMRTRYDEARDALLTFLAGRKDIVALYEFGTVSAPGVSDLDFVIVAADRPEPDLAAALRVDRLPPLVVRMMNGGTMMVMRASEFKDMRWWDDVTVRHLAGLVIAFDEPSGDTLRAVEIARVVDWLPERISRLLAIARRDIVPAQQTLCLLQSVSYTFRRLSASFGIEVPDLESCVRDIHALRTGWFDLHDKQKQARLTVLVERALHVGMSGLRDFAAWCGQNNIYRAPDGQLRELSVGRRARFVFGHGEITVDRALSLSSADLGVVPVPAVLWGHFAAYAAGDGLIAHSLAGTMSPNPSGGVTSPVMIDALARRMDMVERMAAWLRANGFTSGLWKMGWLL